MKLTDTQLVLLSAAAQRQDGAIELGSKLKGGASLKVIAKLLREQLVEEIPATRRAAGMAAQWSKGSAGASHHRGRARGDRCRPGPTEGIAEAPPQKRGTKGPIGPGFAPSRGAKASTRSPAQNCQRPATLTRSRRR